jgi:hypothetical protein
MEQPVQSFSGGGTVQAYDWRNRVYRNPMTYTDRVAQMNAERRQAIDDAELLVTPGMRTTMFGQNVPVVPGSAVERSIRRRAEAAAPPVSSPDVFTAPPTSSAIEMMDRGRLTNDRELYLRGLGSLREVAGSNDVQAPPASRAPTEMFTGPGGGEMYSNDPSRPVMSQLGERAAPPPPPDTREPVKPQGELELSLEAIRSRRAEDRKENALLALMQAGFATAAGQSPNALSNIGAGGQAGIAAFAGMERSSREDQRAAMQDLSMRRRDMSAERLALMKLQEDPDTVKLFKSLGGGDLQKGFAMYNSDKKLQAAIAISKDLTADEGARREAISYLQRSIQGAGAGGGFAGFSARPVSQ